MSSPKFLDLPDLASEAAGGAAILCNDEFFAEKEALLRVHPAVWKEHEYTDRGKWMDGWETRRFRPADGVAPARDSDVHDWCVIRLGMPGVIRGVVIDTAFFRGNYPDSALLEGAVIDDPRDLAMIASPGFAGARSTPGGSAESIDSATWTTILPRTPLQGNHPNAFEIRDPHRYTHVRLVIFPDGGVARLRIHGAVVPDWPRVRSLGGPIDLAALELGAVVETCSDMFFGSRNNLIKPGPSRSMADGWETRRRRGEGNDWAIVRLASAGTIDRVELDTSHFKGNAPALAMIEGTFAPGVAADQLTGWRTLLPKQAVQAHRRHLYDRELRRIGDVTHLRLSVFPCGGVARLRAWGTLAPERDIGLDELNGMGTNEARTALRKCCGSSKWVDAMSVARPFEDRAALLRIGERTWWSLGEADHREAFAAHPKIGQPKPPEVSADTRAWTRDEQAGAAAAASHVLDELAAANREYEDKHGFIFIVCATGRTAEQMLADLRARLPRTPAEELRTAAEEQAKITRLRLHKLVEELGGNR